MLLYVFLEAAQRVSLLEGVLTAYPQLINFEYVGVRTAEFLAWRVQRIFQETKNFYIISID